MPKPFSSFLKPEHQEIARRLRYAFETKNDRRKIELGYQERICAQRYVTRLVNLAGTRPLKSISDNFTRAVLMIYCMTEDGFDTREASLRLASLRRALGLTETSEREPVPARRNTARATKDTNAEGHEQLARLKRRLEAVDWLPENEATRFRLETEIYQLESAADVDEWPEFIRG